MASLVKFTRKLSRLFYTLTYLKPLQLGFFMLRRGLPVRSVTLQRDVERRKGLALQPLLPSNTFSGAEHGFACLNQTVDFKDGGVDWCPESQSRLWCYHLHYFDQLRDPRRSIVNKNFLLDNWIGNNPQGSQPAWEPYTASLRIVNWVSFLSRDNSDEVPPQSWLQSLYLQVLWLEKNDERHILANHYFENIKAWVFAGAFFEGKNADHWLAKGQRLLLEQLSEQFLDDGGHYERSPHYHSLMMENVLDLYNLAVSNPTLFNAETESVLKQTAVRGLEFLDRITFPGDCIPLLNDSVYGSAPLAGDLYGYASQLLETKRFGRSDSLVLIDEPSSGLYGYQHKQDMLVIDCGDIGPDYQPGHTHCDFLSYELMLGGEMLIVDSGVYEYQAGEMRQYVRSTAAHNTLSIDGLDQSEVWGEFRVVRRAVKQQAEVALTKEGGFEFMGSYLGFHQIPGRVIHQRKVCCERIAGDIVFDIQDEVVGQGIHQLDSYLHFHPDITPKELGQGEWCLKRGGQVVAHVLVDGVVEGAVTTHTERGWYCPEFGLKYRNVVLVMTVKSALPAKLGYRITRRI